MVLYGKAVNSILQYIRKMYTVADTTLQKCIEKIYPKNYQ